MELISPRKYNRVDPKYEKFESAHTLQTGSNGVSIPRATRFGLRWMN